MDPSERVYKELSKKDTLAVAKVMYEIFKDEPLTTYLCPPHTKTPEQREKSLSSSYFEKAARTFSKL